MSNMTYEDKTELWQSRMREVQGAIVVASVFEVVLGLTGTIPLKFIKTILIENQETNSRPIIPYVFFF